jgi:hypothetical protein
VRTVSAIATATSTAVDAAIPAISVSGRASRHAFPLSGPPTAATVTVAVEACKLVIEHPNELPPERMLAFAAAAIAALRR